MVTPVHVFTNAEEAELWVNGMSQGRKSLSASEYRARWDEVVYQPGEVKVVTYKGGEEWATESVSTTGPPAALRLTVDRHEISADGLDLSFVTLEVVDGEGNVVRNAHHTIDFAIEGPGEIAATDNGFEADFVPFQSLQRDSFNGLALAIVKARKGKPGSLTITAMAEGLEVGTVTITTKD
jgi:beta-galactosidase